MATLMAPPPTLGRTALRRWPGWQRRLFRASWPWARTAAPGVRRLGDLSGAGEPPASQACHARANGFDLHAGLVVPAGQRERLERVCRYVLRPPVAQERLHVTDEGQVQLQLRHPWRDGTTHVVFDPVEFLGRLAVLVPRPRIHLILYHGVLGYRPSVNRNPLISAIVPSRSPRPIWRASELIESTVKELGGGQVAYDPEIVSFVGLGILAFCRLPHVSAQDLGGRTH